MRWYEIEAWTYDKKVEECWPWDGYVNDRGYGNIRYRVEGEKRGRNMNAHRAFYLALVGPVPEGKQLDHLCRRRSCVNPRHLEVVTCAENLLRSNRTQATVNRAKVTCPQGHPYKVFPSGRRRCTVCELAAERVRRPGHHY